MANTVDKVIKVAKDEMGYLEKKTNQNLDSKTANPGKNNYTKYGAWYGLNPAFWCAMYVCWCFYKAFGIEGGKAALYGSYSASCETLRTRFINKKQYFTTPQIGDLIFFSGTRHAGANHIGIVTDVKDGYVYTMEGNTSSDPGVVDNGGAVNDKKYKIGNSRILGYARPKYDVSTAATTPVKKTYSGSFPVIPPILKKGSKGTQVKYLQKYLNWYFEKTVLVVDGDFGPNTDKYLRKFQTAEGLVVDGEFGPNH